MNSSLARATLVLIPLLGIHEVVFTVLVDECMEGNSRYARDFINLTLSSFQVRLIMLIAGLAMFVSSNSDKNTLFFDRGSWLECCIASRMERYAFVFCPVWTNILDLMFTDGMQCCGIFL